MKHLFPLIFVLAFVSLSSSFAAAADDNLLPNGSLEVDANNDGWPDGWGKAKSGATWEVENDGRFLRLKSEKPGETVLLYQPVPLKNVKALELSWRQRISGLKPGKQPWFDARLMIEFKDAAGKKLKSTVGAPYARKDTDGWVERSVKFLVPAEAAQLELMPALMSVEAGTYDLDDFKLVPTDHIALEKARAEAERAAAEKREKIAAARRAKAAELLAERGSLVSNGDFETPQKKSPSKPEGWAVPKTGSWEDEDGNHFARIVAEPKRTTLLYRTIDLPAGVEALELTFRWRITDLKPGKEAWYDARTMLEFVDAAGKKIPGKPSPVYTRSSTKGWVERKTKFLVPKDALALEFMPALFEVERGTFDLDDVVLKPTDPAILVAEAKARAEEAARANIPPEAPNRAKWPQELHVAGNQVLTADGKPIRLQGVNVVSLEFLVRGDHLLLSCRTAVDDWKANIIRLPVKEDYWFGRRAEQKDGGEAYRKLVDDAVTMVANRGAYVLLDLHRFRAPRAEHVEFWRDAATKYKNHPAMIFDLFNEPHGVSWEVWRDGGFVAEKTKAADEDAFLTADEKKKNAQGFDSPGMQKLVDAVRETGAKNIVLVGGLDWAYDLSGIAKGYDIDERGGNGLICSTHIYTWKSNWKEKVLCVAEKYPILVGEVGCDIKKMDFIPDSGFEDPYTWAPDMLGFMREYGLHYTAFSFHPSASPVMITGWDYTPTPFWGAFVKRALAGEEFPMKRMR
jgi:endoglucanase